jgi:hypothetical protein
MTAALDEGQIAAGVVDLGQVDEAAVGYWHILLTLVTLAL